MKLNYHADTDSLYIELCDRPCRKGDAAHFVEMSCVPFSSLFLPLPRTTARLEDGPAHKKARRGHGWPGGRKEVAGTGFEPVTSRL